ncbi:MAG TPA: GntR family transcriptional regulator, partial [Afifellaceae bacterium]|nr:GntR family transcriptional regulator [Afifellaceae bacterium]
MIEPLQLAAAQPDSQAAPESLTSRIYARLRDDILAARLEPGRKLKIEELRSTYDVGASPIREALSLLVSDHLVERLDQRGFRVADVSSEEFNELRKTRCWLEERALRESITHGRADWEERVVLTGYRLSCLPRSKSDDQY